MSETSGRAPGSGEEQQSPFPSFCRKMAEKIGSCGTMMERCREWMESESSDDEADTTDD